MLYKIYLEKDSEMKDTKIIVEAESEKEALAVFKRQRVYEKGVSKKSYIAEDLQII